MKNPQTAALKLLLLLATASCSNTPSPAKAEGPAQTQAQDAKDAGHGKAVLARYEGIRAALAKDAVKSITADAGKLEKSARAAASAATGDISKRWTGVADAAKHLHDMSKDDPDSVRKAFGELSQALIAVLSADKALAKGLHVFECPMAQGYKKWVQAKAELENPYMGTRMLKCGSKSSL